MHYLTISNNYNKCNCGYSNINFDGKFIYKKTNNKQIDNYLGTLLNSDINGNTLNESIKRLPFDVKIINQNKSKRVIHPRYCFDIYIPETKRNNGIWSRISINAKEPLDENLSKLYNFVTNFNKKYLKNKNIQKISPICSSAQQGEFILSLSYKITY